ncbi:Ribosomal protein L11 methyltransferase [Bdellovibrio bacteriovorus]|uniref:50S ribosomal protein L11 methyltransferase n=1 Tax=Bdellovibrio bacteriovorus TaxID=959 RepID=UPI00045BEBD7|nr:50S ribosomal protein L11 methyltransferase [Bdellovibrio bacteriovorus]AHZ83646.1 membrane protein [Bdellovibrio bacteriovorus]BEV69616.1 Ribosomal protein L11 methyltransferase [Bdellovibrio bacteriovorus]
MSDTNSYFRIRLSQVPAELEDIITTHCFECGASGVTEALPFSQPDLTYDPKILHVRAHEMDVFFNERPECNFFDGLLDLNEGIKWHIHEEETKDWLEEWKKGFKPFKLVGDFWVVPSWLTPPEECKHPIYIDPGMAFGTGTHATTQMMAFFIHKLSEKYKGDLANWAMLDVGTGTAILAMLAQMSGMGLVAGIEIDPEARRVARENVKLNKLPQIEIPETQIEDIRDQYDVVVANIIDGVLINIKKDLLRVLKPGGHMLLTGILEERDNHFFEKFMENSGLTVVRRIEKDEWVGYWVQS